jgi:hypothetical protein
MVIKCFNIFHYKALQNIPKLGFLVFKINHLANLPEIPHRLRQLCT